MPGYGWSASIYQPEKARANVTHFDYALSSSLLIPILKRVGFSEVKSCIAVETCLLGEISLSCPSP